jgi:hypothetical protein
MSGVGRTCGRCSAFRGDTCSHWSNGATERERQVRTHSASQACAPPVNGWDIEWQGISVQWRLDDDGVWYLDSTVKALRSVIGFVVLHPPTGIRVAMYSQPRLRWFRHVCYGSTSDCARALISVYREREGSEV